jgi:hypothetical protein
MEIIAQRADGIWASVPIVRKLKRKYQVAI